MSISDKLRSYGSCLAGRSLNMPPSDAAGGLVASRSTLEWRLVIRSWAHRFVNPHDVFEILVGFET